MQPEPSSSHPAPALVRVVADPNVLVSAAVTPSGVCAQLLSRLLESSLEIVASPLLLGEVERVLRRPRFDLLAPALRVSYVEYLRRITRIEEDPPAGGSPLVAADPSDDYLVRLTLAGDRRLLVSGDRHLIDLAGQYPIVSPRDLLDRLA
jgi:putative PIN family toxin of toxin-antitoxin system